MASRGLMLQHIELQCCSHCMQVHCNALVPWFWIRTEARTIAFVPHQASISLACMSVRAGIGHSLLSYSSSLRGISKLQLDADKLHQVGVCLTGLHQGQQRHSKVCRIVTQPQTETGSQGPRHQTVLQCVPCSGP